MRDGWRLFDFQVLVGGVWMEADGLCGDWM
jgi:hypothetical protein